MRFRHVAGAAAVLGCMAVAVPAIVGAAESFTDVIVRNTSSNPIPTRSTDAPRPYQYTDYISVPAGKSSSCTGSLALNKGRTYVIERLTASSSSAAKESGVTFVAYIHYGSTYTAMTAARASMSRNFGTTSTHVVIKPDNKEPNAAANGGRLCAHHVSQGTPVGYKIAMSGVSY